MAPTPRGRSGSFPSMDLVTLIVAAAESAEEAVGHEEVSETPFFVAGAILAAFAVLVSVAGIRNPRLPDGTVRLITMVGIVLVVAAMAAMVVIST